MAPTRYFDAHLERVRAGLGALLGASPARRQWSARRLVEDLALALQASLLLRHAPPAGLGRLLRGASRRDRGLAFGDLPRGIDGAAIVARALTL